MNIPLLTPDQIEVKIKKVTERGAIALLYKTARVDMEILDQVFGPFGWECTYREVKGNLYCTINVFDANTNQWVEKEDCGIESREDDEGNQKKGEASDAFKRAGFKWGIGRELYSAPFIFLKVETVKKGDRWILKNPFASYRVKDIGYDDEKRINMLTITDGEKIIYSYGTANTAAVKEPSKEPSKAEPTLSAGQLNEFGRLIKMEDDPEQAKARLKELFVSMGYKKLSEVKQSDYEKLKDAFLSYGLPFTLGDEE